MDWVVVILVLFIIAGVWGVVSENKKAKARAEATAAYGVSVDRERQSLLSTARRTGLAPLNPATYQYRPAAREELLAVQENVSRIELRSSGTYRTQGLSLSIPIVKGVRYRVGSGTIRSEKSWQVTASGRLLVTSKAVVFESAEKNERITWGQIADVELMLDGYRIAKRSGPPRTFAVPSPDPRFAAILELMLSRAE